MTHSSVAEDLIIVIFSLGQNEAQRRSSLPIVPPAMELRDAKVGGISARRSPDAEEETMKATSRDRRAT